MLVEGAGLTVFSSLFNDCALRVVIAETATAAAAATVTGLQHSYVCQVPSVIIIALRFRGWWGTFCSLGHVLWKVAGGGKQIVVGLKLPVVLVTREAFVT